MFERIGIIGAGAMGRGIAQLFASAGKQVWLYDARGESVAEALRFNRELLERSLAKGRLSAEALDATLARRRPASTGTSGVRWCPRWPFGGGAVGRASKAAASHPAARW